MKEITKQALAELKLQYSEAAERFAEQLKNKNNKKSEMYADVYDKITDEMEWMHSQYDKIDSLQKKELRASVADRPAKNKNV